MKTKTAKTKPPRPFRSSSDAIDEILSGYGPRARIVVLWRQLDGKRDPLSAEEPPLSVAKGRGGPGGEDSQQNSQHGAHRRKSPTVESL
jgi:hypothetical protein